MDSQILNAIDYIYSGDRSSEDRQSLVESLKQGRTEDEQKEIDRAVDCYVNPGAGKNPKQCLEELEKGEKSPEPKPVEGVVPDFLKKTKFSGQFNASTSLNFNDPKPGSAALPFHPQANNRLRVFDVQDGDFDLNLIEIAAENQPVDWAKIRLDLNFGEDVAVVDSTKGGMVAADEFGIQQAFVEFKPTPDFSLIAGHFVTLLGYEVIESSGNPNTTRSLLFGYAIPFTHTGLLGTYVFSPQVSASLGLVNGWDGISDINDGKTFLGQVVVKPNEKLEFYLQGTLGPEQADTTDHNRFILDFVGKLKLSDNLNLGLNFDYGREGGLPDLPDPATWHGLAFYLHGKPSERIGLTFRGEYFHDDGSRTGIRDLDVIEATGTFHVYIADGFEARAELRVDGATDGQEIFTTASTDNYSSVQPTIGVEILYSFN